MTFTSIYIFMTVNIATILRFYKNNYSVSSLLRYHADEYSDSTIIEV